MSERWPPAYDENDLRESIAKLAGVEYRSGFYDLRDVRPGLFQGDLVVWDIPLVLIGPDAKPGVVRRRHPGFWVVGSNTCDLDRSIGDNDDTSYATLWPVRKLGTESELSGNLDGLRHYRISRRFYLPPWDTVTEGDVHVAELTMPMSVHRRAVQAARLVARLSRTGWYLLNACLVRFCSRDDGRNDGIAA